MQYNTEDEKNIGSWSARLLQYLADTPTATVSLSENNGNFDLVVESNAVRYSAHIYDGDVESAAGTMIAAISEEEEWEELPGYADTLINVALSHSDAFSGKTPKRSFVTALQFVEEWLAREDNDRIDLKIE